MPAQKFLLIITLLQHGHLALDGDGDTHIMVTDGATLIMDGAIQDGATQVGAIQVGDTLTMVTDITTLTIMEEEVLRPIMETETMLTTETTPLAEDTQQAEGIQLIETILPIEEVTQQIETIPQIETTQQTDLTVIPTSEVLARTEEQLVLHLQIEDLTIMALTTVTTLTATEDLITTAEIPQQTEATPLTTIAVHQEATLQAVAAHQEAIALAIVAVALDHTAVAVAAAE